MKRLLFALLFVACAAPPPDEAAARIWADFGRTGRPPAVSWRQGPELDCADGRGWLYTPSSDQERMHMEVMSGDSTCVAGLTWAERWYSEVALPTEALTVDQTALTHELNHARLWITTGDDDPDHKDPSFAIGGLVDQENVRLASVSVF